jgi:hypothetical protein
VSIFEREKATVCYVELEASVEERLKRNISPNRLRYKPSKNDFNASEKELLETDRQHTLNSDEGEFRNKNHLKINNTKLNAERVAEIIKERFGL